MQQIGVFVETLSLLQQTELRIRNTQEDLNIINKMIELSKLLREEHKVMKSFNDRFWTGS